jgi:hypothetical protein
MILRARTGAKSLTFEYHQDILCRFFLGSRSDLEIHSEPHTQFTAFGAIVLVTHRVGLSWTGLCGLHDSLLVAWPRFAQHLLRNSILGQQILAQWSGCLRLMSRRAPAFSERLDAPGASRCLDLRLRRRVRSDPETHAQTYKSFSEGFSQATLDLWTPLPRSRHFRRKKIRNPGPAPRAGKKRWLAVDSALDVARSFPMVSQLGPMLRGSHAQESDLHRLAVPTIRPSRWSFRLSVYWR